MRRVTIFTLVGANNIGAFLQGFALKEVLARFGYEVEFGVMPSHGKKDSKLSRVGYYMKHGNIKLLGYKMITARKYEQMRKHLVFRNITEDEVLDVVVVGSDEVWNLESSSFYHHPQYFAKKLKAKKMISYAACCGNCSKEKLIENGLDFSGFDHISVRDAYTSDFVCSVDSRTPEIVLDPTFLLSSYESYLPDIAAKDYIMIYSYGLDKNAIALVKKFAKQTGLKKYSVGTYNSWCDKNITADPFTMLAYLKNAAYVVTSTFHGTALSIKFNKEFTVFAGNGQKVLSLLNTFSLMSRDASESADLKSIFSDPIDYRYVNSVLTDEIDKSVAYLTKAIFGE